jgi:hypothetical protein
MPELPDRPDLDQLRHQARDLHRAAAAGVPDALTRIRRFSDRIALSTAQLSVAREYGYPSWPALQAEVRRRRSLLPAAISPPAGGLTARGGLDPRYSFGGGMAIQAAEGVLSPDVLSASDRAAVLRASAVLYAQAPVRRVARRFNAEHRPGFNDLAGADDKGTTYSLRFGSGSFHFPRNAEDQQPSELSFWVDPVPPADATWIELRAQSGAVTRLLPSPRAAVRVGDLTVVSAKEAAERKLQGLAYFLLRLRHSVPHGDLSRERTNALARSGEIQESGVLGDGSELPAQVARLCQCLTDEQLAEGLPTEWQRFEDADKLADGTQRHLDLDVAVPQLGDLQVQLDHLVSGPGSWRLYLRAKPTWWGYSEDGRRKWELVSVHADDDLGGRYVSNFGGSSGERDYEDLKLEFLPRIDPLARSLKLTFSTETAQAAVHLDLASAAK